MPDGVSDRAEDADRREQHHQVREFEHGLGETLGELEERAALFLRHHRQRETKEHAEDHNLQHFALVHGLGDVLWENVHDEIAGRARRGIQRERCGGGRKFHAFAGAAEIYGDESDHQRQRRDDFEIDERLDAHAANFFQIGVARDAHHQRAEDQRRDNYFD